MQRQNAMIINATWQMKKQNTHITKYGTVSFEGKKKPLHKGVHKWNSKMRVICIKHNNVFMQQPQLWKLRA